MISPIFRIMVAISSSLRLRMKIMRSLAKGQEVGVAVVVRSMAYVATGDEAEETTSTHRDLLLI